MTARMSVMSREWWAGYRLGFRDGNGHRRCECFGCRFRRWFGGRR